MSSVQETTSIIKIFFCYAREDEQLRNQVENQLMILKNQGLIVNWYDRKISPGNDWRREIDTHLNTAQIILLLISPAFMISEYCWGVEMKRALERQSVGEARVIPVILRPVPWEDAPFSKLQVLPTGGKPVTTWANTDEAYEDIARGIRKTVKELLASYKIEEGDKLYAGKRNEEALVAYDQAINYDPNSANAYNSKGNTLAALKRYSEALTVYDQAILLDPHFKSARNGKDRVLGQFDKLQEAQQQLETQLRKTQEQLRAQQLQTQQLKTQLREALQLEAQLREILQPLVPEVQVEEEIVPQAQKLLPSLSSEKSFRTLSSQIGNKSVNLPKNKLTIDITDDTVTRGGKKRTLLISVLLIVGLLFLSVLAYYSKSSIAQTNATATVNAYATTITHTHVIATANAYNTNTAKGIMFGFDPQHTHFNSYERMLSPQNVSSLVSYWTASTSGTIDTSPTVANGMVYIGSNDGYFYAFNAAGCGSTSCTPIWSASTGGAIHSSPTVANGIVYIGSDDFKLYAYHLSVNSK